ncbi:hypothetical protein G5B10_15070 [Fluviicola sp. SGL-29]|nr:hypothetical protein [Fluviicola sp. SGL-29]
MAGGKETPRQKMIGMMYLVLTALLALNVSKSILDAFVAIEENIQKANIVQADRGTGFVNDVKSELTTSKGEDQAAKKQKLQYVLDQMKKIDDETAKFIEFTDKLKVDILKEAGEKVDSYNDKNPESILWIKQREVLPTRMNLAAVQGQDKYDEPMLVLGINEDIKSPKGKGAELWKRLNDFRKKIIEYTGTYKWGESNNFSVNVDAINDFETNAELSKKVNAMIDKNTKANLKEDRQVLIDLYMMLTKKERNDVHDQKGVHWVGMTFDHSPLVAAIASLSSLQQDVLSARALALAHWKGKVSTGEYSFNKIMPLAHGDLIANSGDSAYVKVMMAAFDSDNQPKVIVEEGAPDARIDVKNGQGVVGFKVAGGTEQILKGTVAIKNKSGVWKTEKWEHKIVIMKPSGAISLPELNVLYRSYDNKVEAVASGFDQTVLTGSVPLSKSGNLWIAKPTGSGKEATLTVSGKNTVTGKTQQLLTQKFRVSNLPDPELYWGAAKNGDKGQRTETKLFAKYGPEIPLNAQFRIVSWEVQIPGAQGAPPKGTGGVLDGTASGLIKQAKPGMQVSFICTVVGPDGIQRKRAGAFKV